VAFGPDGQTMAAAGSNRTLVLFDLRALGHVRAHPRAYACALTGGGMTRADWERYVPGLDYVDTCPD